MGWDGGMGWWGVWLGWGGGGSSLHCVGLARVGFGCMHVGVRRIRQLFVWDRIGFGSDRAGVGSILHRVGLARIGFG